MIQPLRTAHRRVLITLAFALPVVVAAGLGARFPRPLPGPSAVQLPSSAYVIRESDQLWRGHTIQSKFYGEPNRLQEIYVVLQPAQDLGEPDLLLYWFDNESPASSLPAQAQLLGAFGRNNVFALPPNARHSGQLILYSLAHEAVFDTAVVEKLP